MAQSSDIASWRKRQCANAAEQLTLREQAKCCRGQLCMLLSCKVLPPCTHLQYSTLYNERLWAVCMLTLLSQV